MRLPFKPLLALLMVLPLTACLDKQVDQTALCTFTSDADARLCKEGELAWFKPARWGNEQLPLSVAAAYCDFNHPVMHNNAGVICVFTEKRLRLVNGQ